MKIYCLSVLLLLLNFLTGYGQAFISRNIYPVPLEKQDSTDQFLGDTGFQAEANRGFFSNEEALAWNIKYIGFIELYRWGDRAVLGGTLAHELIANPYNDINFHMRSAIWNESITYFRKFSGFSGSIGVRHHCKHEIDNSKPRKVSTPREDYIPTRRLIVLTAPFVAIHSSSLHLGEQWTAKFRGMVNYYTYNWDTRVPKGNQSQSIFHLKASLQFSAKINWHFQEGWKFYQSSWFNPVYFTRDDPFKSNWHLELGIQKQGEKADFELYLANENYFDDFSRPYPHPSNVVNVGARIVGHSFY